MFLGAAGNQNLVPDHVSLRGLLIKIRREFEQVINVRPAKLLPGITSPLVNPKDFDLIVVRENSEGEYSSVGGRIYQGEDEIAIQNAVFSRRGTDRVICLGTGSVRLGFCQRNDTIFLRDRERKLYDKSQQGTARKR
ncbi:Tartrate dehydrogenase / Tartrate decarboxylase / D-malic enzyme [Bacillus velezensis]|nr:Tartrate dehydrogenase / Tartrate decarboxylase / D-malic enzyme [Bacillus velezensis]